MSKKEERIYPGELLKEARKKTRRKYKRFSSELGIPEKYLEALEENNFSIMAGPTYIKGYLRACLLYTSPSPRDQRGSRMPSSA